MKPAQTDKKLNLIKNQRRRWAMGKTRGFTLVELAIVLVIIGIILGAILKGQELINNAKVKRLQNDLRGLEAAIWTFYDRTGRMPGDCNKNETIEFQLPTTPPTLSTSTSPPSNYCTNENADAPFDDLKYARILPQNAANADLAKTPFSGSVFAIGYNGTAGYNAIAIYNVPAWAARMIDVSIDGSENGTAGRIRKWDSDGDWPTNQDQAVAIIYYFDRI
jgi:prepilin-type N-terminal cleavage/methylation domain-containing protein